MKSTRRLKIHTKHRTRRWDSTTVPQIRLEGKWLERLGFIEGCEVDIEHVQDRITITVRQGSKTTDTK